MGYGAVADWGVAGSRGRRRLFAASALLVTCLALVAAAALSGQQDAAPDDNASGPALLANMAELSARAVGVADSLIAADVSRDEHPGAARTTDLASQSSLTPMVNPFPNWKYNVFDPKLPFDPPHHRWTKRRLRLEAKRLIGLVSEAQSWQDKKYREDTGKSESVATWLSGTLDNITNIESEAKTHMEVIYEGLRVAGAGIGAAAATTRKQQMEIDHEEDKKKRAVWEILEEHHEKLDWDRDLQEQHDLLMKANVYKQEKMDTLDINRADAEIGAAFQDVNGRIEGMRGRIDANMSIFKNGSLEMLQRLDRFKATELEDMKNSYRAAMTQQAGTLNLANRTTSFGHTVDAYDRSTSQRLRGITGLEATFANVTFGIDAFETHMQTAQGAEASQISELEEQFKTLKQKLTDLVAVSATVQSAMEEEQAAHSALVHEENEKMQEFNDAVADMEPQITQILDLSGTISSLEVDTGCVSRTCLVCTFNARMLTPLCFGCRKRIEKVKTNWDSVETMKNKTMAEEEALKTGLAALLVSVNAQQAFDASDESRTSYAALDSATAPINSQISLVAAMSQKIGELDAILLGSNQNLTKQVVALDEGRKKWRDETEALRQKLEEKAAKEIATAKVTSADPLSVVACLRLLRSSEAAACIARILTSICLAGGYGWKQSCAQGGENIFLL